MATLSKTDLQVFVKGLPGEKEVNLDEIKNLLKDGANVSVASLWWKGKNVGIQLKTKEEVDLVREFLHDQVYVSRVSGKKYTLIPEQSNTNVINPSDLSCSVVVDLSQFSPSVESEEDVGTHFVKPNFKDCGDRFLVKCRAEECNADDTTSNRYRIVFAKKSMADAALKVFSKVIGAQNVQLASLVVMAHTEKAGRLIVRNLNFATEELNIRKMFEKYGELAEVSLPKKDGKRRGFAFVQYKDRNNAETAIVNLNGGKLCGRVIAVDWCVQKDVYTQVKGQQKVEKKPDEETAEETKSVEKKPFEKKPAEKEEEQESNEEKVSDEEKDSDDDSDSERKEKKKSVKKANSTEDNDRTVFVLNVPFDANVHDISKAFSKFGPVARVFLTPDPTKENPHRGSCFVKFVTEAGAQKTLADEKRLQDKLRLLGGKNSTAQQNLLDGFGITVKNRRLIVKKTESREEVGAKTKKSFKEQRQAAKNKWSHLLKMGDIEEQTAEFKELSRQEQNIRKQSIQEKKFKIKDPNYVVNPNRLVIKNLPLNVDTLGLKNKIVEILMTKRAQQADAGNTVGKKLSRELAAGVKKVQLMRSQDRKTEDGQRRSLGFAFIDFEKHDLALETLKTLNNNSKVFDKKRPIVEFTFDDKRALRVLEQAQRKKEEKQKRAAQWGEETEQPAKKKRKKNRNAEAAEGEGAAGQGEDNNAEAQKNANKKLSRGQRQREKRRQAKLQTGKKDDNLKTVIKEQKKQESINRKRIAREEKVAQKRQQRRAQKQKDKENDAGDGLEQAYLRKLKQ